MMLAAFVSLLHHVATVAGGRVAPRPSWKTTKAWGHSSMHIEFGGGPGEGDLSVFFQCVSAIFNNFHCCPGCISSFGTGGAAGNVPLDFVLASFLIFANEHVSHL